MRRTTPLLAATPVLLAAALATPCVAVPAHATTARAMSVSSQVVPLGTYPWAVALEHRQAGTDAQVTFCGGTLIAPRYVMTAAHCAQEEGLDTPADVARERLTVRFANLDGQPTVAAVRFVTSGSYWYGLWGRRPQHDIGLVELTTDAPTAPQAISRQVPATGAPVTALGYGVTPDNRTMSSDLRQVWSVTSAPARCGGTSTAGFTVQVFPKAEICTTAGPADTSPPLDGATCGGDSGSPLALADMSAVVGVVSWGRVNACRVPPSQRSSVFAQAGPVAGWLQRQTGAALFGQPAVAVNQAVPAGATLRRGRLAGTGVPVQVGARGNNWRAMAYVQFVRDTDTGAPVETVGLALGPTHQAGTVHAPPDWGTRPAGLQVTDVAVRIWCPGTLNGVTLHAP